MKISQAIAAALAVFAFVQLASVNTASAAYRCGTWIQNGTIHIGPDCGRRPHWQHDSRGRRYWGSRPSNGTVYYTSPKFRHRTVMTVTRRPLVKAQSNYVPGAPRNPQECFARGGQLANGGRGCSGYR